jgi:hypothetical protein
VCQVNNSVTFSGIPIGSEEFFNRMDETLGITIDDVLREDFVKGENKPYIIEKMGCVPIYCVPIYYLLFIIIYY